jgi:DNA-binding CsgD family transcriptional regulator
MAATSERRATIRVFIIDERLNVLHGSEPSGSLPAGLRRTVSRLLPTFEGHVKRSQAVAVSEGRVVRLIPVAAKMFAVAVERFVSHAMLRHAIKEFKLTSREVDVLLLALEGCTAAETAERLELAISTVNDHLNHLLLKTGSRNKSALIAKVLGWRPE